MLDGTEPTYYSSTQTCGDRENTSSLIWVNEGHSDIKSKPRLITLSLFCIWPPWTNQGLTYLFGAKNCKTTNRKGKDLISRFVVTALKLIFRWRPSRLGEADWVKLNILLIYVAHRPCFSCREFMNGQSEHVLHCNVSSLLHMSALSASGWPISHLSLKHNMKDNAH